MLLLQSAVFLVQKWVEWFIPGCFITVLCRGFRVTYLVCTGSFRAAFWFALGFEALIDAYAPPQVTRTSLFTALQTALHLAQLCAALHLYCAVYVSAFG